MSRAAIIEKSLRGRGALIKVKNLDEACEIANRIAPEHLELSVANPRKWLKKIRHAGAIFLGPYTSEALGDYCAGPNHVLPTSRTAKDFRRTRARPSSDSGRRSKASRERRTGKGHPRRDSGARRLSRPIGGRHGEARCDGKSVSPARRAAP